MRNGYSDTGFLTDESGPLRGRNDAGSDKAESFSKKSAPLISRRCAGPFVRFDRNRIAGVARPGGVQSGSPQAADEGLHLREMRHP